MHQPQLVFVRQNEQLEYDEHGVAVVVGVVVNVVVGVVVGVRVVASVDKVVSGGVDVEFERAGVVVVFCATAHASARRRIAIMGCWGRKIGRAHV